MAIEFHNFDSAPGKKFIKKKSPRLRLRPGTTGARRSRRFTSRPAARTEISQHLRQFGH
jgi:hypothetical protein